MASSFQVTKSGNRTRVETGAKWEAIVGYSRAVRVGSHIAVTGTVGIRPDGSFPLSVSDQARHALTIIDGALKALGANLADVIRTRIYVLDISLLEQVGEVHREFFGDIRPSTTMIQVAGLVPGALVEIEADAIVLS
jgi:enamine deaminase RidA (YjgF/YER057c/UK114 family)